jgi:hypothetical protein
MKTPLALAAVVSIALLPLHADDKDGEDVPHEVVTVKRLEPDGKGRVPVILTGGTNGAANRVGKMPKVRPWKLGVDGKFDHEGFNIELIDPSSGMLKMRCKKEGVEDGDAPIPAKKGDVITHINGVRITSPTLLVFAVNAADNPRDLAVVLKDGDTGKSYLYYVTARKELK